MNLGNNVIDADRARDGAAEAGCRIELSMPHNYQSPRGTRSNIEQTELKLQPACKLFLLPLTVICLDQ
jgi:hypothetical protein